MSVSKNPGINLTVTVCKTLVRAFGGLILSYNSNNTLRDKCRGLHAWSLRNFYFYFNLLRLEDMQEILSRSYFNNTVQDYLIAAGGILLGMLILRIFRKTLLIRLKKWSDKTVTDIDNYIVDGIQRFGLPILNFLIIYFGVNYLTISEKATKYVHGALAVVITYYSLRLISSTILLVLQSTCA